MPVQIFSRSNPNRDRSQARWFEQIRLDHLKLEPGHPGMPLIGTSPAETSQRCAAAGAHEIKLPERGIVQVCKHCRRGTRGSLWVARCGPCGRYFSPLLWLANACDDCGGANAVLERLAEHLERAHTSAASIEQ